MRWIFFVIGNLRGYGVGNCIAVCELMASNVIGNEWMI